MTEQEKLSKQLQYKKLGFTRFESAIGDSKLSQIEEALKDVKLHEAQDYSLPRKTLGEIRSATRGLKKKIFDGVGLQVDYFPLEIPMPNAPQSSIPQKLIERVKQFAVLYKRGQMNDDRLSDEMAKEYNKASTKMNIFDIPVMEDADDYSTIGQSLKGPIMVLGKSIDKFFKQTPVLVEAIILGTKELNELAIGTYAHELSHLLIDRHKGVVQNYLNDEILSSFEEKEAMYFYDQSEDKHLYKIWEICRLKNVMDHMDGVKKASDEFEKRDSLKYVQSSLYSGILFDKYINAPEGEQRRIKQEIAKVYNGRSNIDKMLSNIGITLNQEDIDKYINKVKLYAKEMEQYQKTHNREDDGDIEI